MEVVCQWRASAGPMPKLPPCLHWLLLGRHGATRRGRHQRERGGGSSERGEEWMRRWGEGREREPRERSEP